MSNTKKDPNLCQGQAVNAMQAANQQSIAQQATQLVNQAQQAQAAQSNVGYGASAPAGYMRMNPQQWWSSPETVAVAHASALEPRLPDLPEEQLIQLYGLVVAQLMMRGLA